MEALRGAEQAFGHFDVLTDESIRAGIKAFADWPTFPQLFVEGELLGGCDIITEMQSRGELKGAIEVLRRE